MNKSSPKFWPWLMAAICAFLFVLGGVLVVVYPKVYNYINGYPSVKQGLLDCSDIENWGCLKHDIYLLGEWEFFYNDWIITDGIEREPDGYICIPGSWYGMEVDGKRLSKTGYASYRLRLEGVAAEYIYGVLSSNYNGAYRVYFDGELNKEYGKFDDKITVNNGRYSADKNLDILALSEIVVEISYNEHGGFNMPFTLFLTDKPQTGKIHSSDMQKTFSRIGIGAALVCFFVAFIIFLVMNKWYKNRTYILLSTAIVLQILFSTETRKIWRISWKLSSVPAYMTICLLLTSLLLIVILYFGIKNRYIKAAKSYYIISGTSFGVYGLLYALCYGTHFNILSLFVIGILGTYSVFVIDYSHGIVSRLYAALISVAAVLLVAVSCFFQGYLKFSFTGVNTVFSIVCVILVFSIYAILVREKYMIATKSNAVRVEMEAIKNLALKAQVKTDFVERSLSAISYGYASSKDDGAAVLTKFSKHLRLFVDAEKNTLVAFEEEINNIYQYFELENIHKDNNVMLLMDVEELEFFIPTLFLQPLIENAFLHAKLEETEEPTIIITARREEYGIYLAVEDNGCGFDATPNNYGIGLRNFCDRAKYILDADVHITSVEGETKIQVKIPNLKENENENNHC